MNTKWLWLIGAVGGAYYLSKRGKGSSSIGNPGLSGVGAGGAPRLGQPKTEAERMATHAARYGEDNLPPRGTGLGIRTGRGIGGVPRMGRPKSEEERRASHSGRYGTEELPPRGRGQGLA